MTDHPHAADPAAPPAIADQDDFPPLVYDPADYRWVPVRRRPRLDGWTEEKMRRFIEVLADTGQVGLAARAVGLSRESAYKLRRAPHAAAFARAWEAARDHAGTFLEDVAFERAVEGAEHNVFNERGEVICTKRVHNDRLLMFLLRHLKPERYARDALAVAPPPASIETMPIEASLRALEPPSADPAARLDPQELDYELRLANVADGALSHFLSEQRPEPLPAQVEAARRKRGEAAWDKVQNKDGNKADPLSAEEFADMCHYIDPTGGAEPPRRRYR